MEMKMLLKMLSVKAALFQEMCPKNTLEMLWCICQACKWCSNAAADMQQIQGGDMEHTHTS